MIQNKDKFMKTLSGTLLIILFLFSAITLKAQNSDFSKQSDYKWQNRVLLIFSPNTYNSDYRDQVDALKKETGGIKERDLKIFYALEQTSASVKGTLVPEETIDELRSEFVVLLIGKDGDEKYRNDEFLTANKLFKEIDSMPMRKLEMDDGENN
jgi:hypothetical protein